MQSLSPQQAFQLAVERYQSGRLGEAEDLCKQVLAQQPRHVDALYLLGILAHHARQPATAVDLIRQAIAINQRAAIYHANLGVVLAESGQLDEAIGAYRDALALEPRLAEAHNNLANALRQKGRVDEAIASYRRAIELKSDSVEALNNLANLLIAQGDVDPAIELLSRAAGLRPDYAEAQNSLAAALLRADRLDEAMDASQHAIALRPNYAEALNTMGNILQRLGKPIQAAESYREAIALNPSAAEFHYNLGAAFEKLHQPDDALACFDRAITLRPELATAHKDRGNMLAGTGRLDEALAAYRQAVALEPGNAAFHSDLLYALHFHPEYDAHLILQEHRRWNERHAKPRESLIQPHENDRTPGRNLRIGYVSADLRDHPVGKFLLPILAHHDREQFEVFCYSNSRETDWMTQRLKEQTQVWRDVARIDDRQLAQQIRQDKIDILIDLSLHTGGNRLLAFAQKPAPVQVTYLAYCSTSGMDTMDYRLTNPHLDPPEFDDGRYSERSVHLPDSYWCFDPPAYAPAVGPLPAKTNGYVTFGSLNQFKKVSPFILNAWIDLMRSLPNSRLILHAYEGSHRQRIGQQFIEAGIEHHRLEFAGYLPTVQYLEQYNRIDIALDSYPFAGGTTTCDALWMGIPVVTMTGRTAVSRGAASVLANVGLNELIGSDREELISIASRLVADVDCLAELRMNMRERIRASTLVDSPRFTARFERALRQMWADWCEKQH